MISLREQWGIGGTTIGAWLSNPSAISAELAARIGFDYVCVDNQHGAVDYQASIGMIQAVLLGGSRPLARAPWNEPGSIAKLLDAGAEGVIVPMVNSASEAVAVVRACRYPPAGGRSFGPTIVGMRHDDYLSHAKENIAVIPMIETAEAISNLDAIVAVPGIDAVYVGPADLSVSLGLAPRNNDGEATFDDALVTIVAACRGAGVVPGIHTTAALVPRRLEQGFRMLTVSTDLVAMRSAMADDLAIARRGSATFSV